MEWFDPVFASGHWVPEMVELAGGEDALGLAGRDSRKIRWETVVAYDPEVLILMPVRIRRRPHGRRIPLLSEERRMAVDHPR